MKNLPLENSWFAELNKIAGFEQAADYDSEAVEHIEPMNPDVGIKRTQGDAEAEKAKSEDDKDKELQEKKDEITKDTEDSREDKEGSEEYAELISKIAEVLPEMGALAKLVEWSRSTYSDEFLQKQAAGALDTALTDEENYVHAITKVAETLFSSQENIDQLFSQEGMDSVTEQLAFLVEDEEIEKMAGGGEFLSKVRDAATGVINSMKRLNAIKAELAAAQLEHDNIGKQLLEHDVGSPQWQEAAGQVPGINEKIESLDNQRLTGLAGRGAAGVAAAGGAMMAGKKVYDWTHKSEDGADKSAAEEDKVLLTKIAGGKLSTEYPFEIGGWDHMSNKQLVRDFLKIAGAGALIEISNNESLDMGMRKEASDTFHRIAAMGRKDMDEAFVKVAQEVYPENQLHEIVSGRHSNELFSKVAFFLEANDMSVDELTKVAGAEGVAAKGVAGALTDAKTNIEATIEQDKKKAEGVGRDYVGVLKAHEGDHEGKGTGLAGGGLVSAVSGTAGYSVINNPGKYDIEQTAAMMEEAVLAKQAAAETFARADAFLKYYAGALAGK